MQRVYLNGGIAEFGPYWESNCTNIRDIFKLIDCQTPGFRKYIIDAAESGVGFEIQRGSEILSDEQELFGENSTQRRVARMLQNRQYYI